MKATPNLNFTTVDLTKESLKIFVTMLRSVYQHLTDIINGKIGFGDGTNRDNIDGSWINVVAPAAPNTDFTVNHNLSRLPVGYWIMQKDRAVDVYTGSVAATSTALTLRATVASAAIRLFIICLLLGLFVSRSEAQGANHTNIALASVRTNVGTVAQPIASAIITVCNGSMLPAAGSTCTGLASIFSNRALTTALPNPTNADVNGNFTFWASPGPYVVSVAGVGFVTYSYAITASCDPADACTLTGPLTLTNLTVSGTGTFTGLLNCKNLDNVFCVDDANSQGWAGTDIGGWINSAYTGCLPGTCTIIITSSTGNRVNFSTPMLFTTADKFPHLIFRNLSNGQATGGMVLNYTPTTSTKAITLDYGSTGGIQWIPAVIEGLTLINNGCATNGGCGSSAIGIGEGAVNFGGPFMQLRDGAILGFGTGIKLDNGSSWGMSTLNETIGRNTTGINIAASSYENFYLGPVTRININGTGITWTGVAVEVNGFGVSFDSNATGVSGTQGMFVCQACHFEATVGFNPNFVNGGANVIISGQALDDTTVGTYTGSWFTLNGNSDVTLAISTGGRTPTTGVFSFGGRGKATVLNQSPGTLTPCPTFSTTTVCSEINASGTPFINTPVLGLGTTAGQYKLVATAGDSGHTGTFPPNTGIVFVGGTGGAGLTLKKGSGAGNYTNATTSYTVADSTNLCFTVTIPTGWKLGVSASGALATATAAVVAQAALTDNAACSTANAGILVETAPILGAAIGAADSFALNWVITGDGAAHNIALQFKTSNAADTASLINSSATITPTMKFELMPSN